MFSSILRLMQMAQEFEVVPGMKELQDQVASQASTILNLQRAQEAGSAEHRAALESAAAEHCAALEAAAAKHRAALAAERADMKARYGALWSSLHG